MPNHKKLFPIGATYGHWTIIGPVFSIGQIRRRYYCNCRCTCGTEQPVRTDQFKKGNPKCKRCGAQQTADLLRTRIEPETVFGSWTVIGLSKHRDKSGKISYYDCVCACGEKSPRRGSSLVNGVSQRCKFCAAKIPRKHGRLRPYECVFNTFKNFCQRDFTLTFENFLDLIKTGRCHYCWVCLFWEKHTYSGKGKPYQIDRKDNAEGYTLENSVACCKRCNFAKREMFSYEEWFGMTEYFRRHKSAF